MSTGQRGGKPTENDGLRKDGQHDKRVGTGEFGGGQVNASEAGKIGGKASGQSSGGSAKGEFGHGNADPVEAGKRSHGGGSS